MNRFIIIPLGFLSLLAAVTMGCAVDTTTSDETSEDALTHQGVRMVGIGSDGSEQESVANGHARTRHVAEGAKAPGALCLNCGPVPDPWKNAPISDPWTQPASSSGGVGNGGASSSGSPGHK